MPAIIQLSPGAYHIRAQKEGQQEFVELGPFTDSEEVFRAADDHYRTNVGSPRKGLFSLPGAADGTDSGAYRGAGWTYAIVNMNTSEQRFEMQSDDGLHTIEGFLIPQQAGMVADRNQKRPFHWHYRIDRGNILPLKGYSDKHSMKEAQNETRRIVNAIPALK